MFWKSLSAGVVICAVSVSLVGCKARPTYISQKINSGDHCFRGAPHVVYKSCRAVVTWYKPGSKETIQTTHFCRVPETYSLDVQTTPLGTTHAIVEYQEDGSLGKAEVEVDQQVDEFITAAAGAVGDIAGALGGARSDDEKDPFSFSPPLNDPDMGPNKDGYFVQDIRLESIDSMVEIIQ